MPSFSLSALHFWYVPLDRDFGASHPDPNLMYAYELVERVEKDNISLHCS